MNAASANSSGRFADRRFAISVDEIEQLLRAQVETLGRELLPNAKVDGRHLCVGSLSGEPGQSLKINLQGPKRGLWADFSALGSEEGGGDCIGLIRMIKFGGDVAAAVQWAKSWLGIDDLDPERLETRRREVRAQAAADEVLAAAEKEQKRKRAVAMWMGGKPIAGTPAEWYLRGRGIDIGLLGTWPGSLRFHAEIWNRELGHKIPAMLACMVTPEGKHVATHRTYLTHDERKGWVKLDSPNAKMVLGGSFGSFIPLRKGASGKSMADMPEGEPFYISEGIEDALTAAMARPGLRIGASYSLGNIGSIDFPGAMGPLRVMADRDEYGSQAADLLERVIRRQQAKGVHVQLILPKPPFKDLNDWLRAALPPRDEGVEY